MRRFHFLELNFGIACYTSCNTWLCTNPLETRMDTGFALWPVAPHQPPQVQ